MIMVAVYMDAEFYYKNKILMQILLYILYSTDQLSLCQSHWIGKKYYKRGPNGNDIHKTNVPHIRLEFRDTV